MKKNLLVTTALVAAFMTSNALADEFIRNQEQLNYIDKDLTFIKFDNTNGKADNMGSLTLNDNLVLNGQVTLHDQVTLEGGKNLTVNGWFTETQSGSDVSGVDVVVNEGGLTLGNDLTVGDMTIGDGADIALYNIGSDASKSLEKVLNVTDGSVLYFGGKNEIRDSGQSTTKGNTLTINADNALVTFDTKDLNKNGALTLGSDVTINGKATLHTKTSVTGGKNLTVNGWLTQSASGSDVSDVNVAVNEKGLVLGNDLTVGNMTIGSGADVVLYTTDEVAETIGQYAKAPEKTLNVKNTLTFAGDNKIRDYASSTETGSLTINGGNVKNEGVLTGNFTLDGGSYGFAVNEDATSDAYVDGTITLNGTVKLAADVSNVSSSKTGTLEFATAVNGTGSWDASGLTNNIFNVSISDGKNALEFAAKSASDIAASTGASGSQAAAVNAIISGGTEDTGNASFEAVAGEVKSLMQSPNKADVAKALEMVDKMSSDLSNAVTASVVANNAQVLAAVGSRFTGGNVAPAQQGMSSGDSWFEKGAAWVQGLFNKSKLDTSNGFEADSEGIAFGFEKIVNDGNAKVGLGYAYSTSDIDADSRDVDADTHTLMVYGEYKPADWFVNGVLSYSFGDYDETSSVKSASYDVDSYGLQVMGGFEKVLDNGAVVTPSAGLRYLHVDPDSYTDSLGSKVDGDESDVITAVAGAKVTKTWELENGKVLKPEVRAALTYDLTEAEDTTVMTLANGSTYAVEGENLDRLGFEFGAGISADINDNVEISLGYEGKFREDYQDHTGMINAKYKF